jgi:ornithine cyclodeaminase
MLVLNEKVVREALPMAHAIEAMKQAFASLSSGKAIAPLRTNLSLLGKEAYCLVMPSFVQGQREDVLAVKIVSVYPHNRAQGFPMIHGAVLLFEANRGTPVAIIDGASLTAIRTGAASGLATDLLGRSDSHTLVLFGTGVQAHGQIEAVCTVRKIDKVWICGRSVERKPSVDQLIQKVAGRGPIPSDVDFTSDHEAALAEADIVCTATSSKSPVFSDSHLPPGVHINAVGSHCPTEHEIPIETVTRSRVVVESRSAALAEAGELCLPIQQGLVSEGHIYAELGELVLNLKGGRASVEQITLFKSVGVAVQDAVAGQMAYERAREMGLGQKVDW